jgi:hypothetical protein
VNIRCQAKIARRQWEIIHGRLLGKLFDPLLPLLTRRDVPPEQQAQPPPCDPLSEDSVRGALALRSLAACAARVCAETVEQYGAVRKARGASAAQCGHSDGEADSAIGRISVNGPHRSQR